MILTKAKKNEIEKVLNSGNIEATLTFIKFNRRAWNTYRRIKQKQIRSKKK
jgi:Icc-related predicted phosphoesterase